MSRLPRIVVEVIVHAEQRYPTAGDYFADGDAWMVRVSDCGDERYEFLVALHEMVEWFLTQQRGIAEEDIARFDRDFEQAREAGQHGDLDEAGDDPAAPYRREHRFATRVEWLMAEELGVDWDEYGAALGRLYESG